MKGQNKNFFILKKRKFESIDKIKVWFESIDFFSWEVSKFESDLLRKIKSSQPEILETIKKEQKISEEIETKLKKLIEEFVNSFINHKPSSDIDKVGLNDRLQHEKK